MFVLFESYLSSLYGGFIFVFGERWLEVFLLAEDT